MNHMRKNIFRLAAAFALVASLAACKKETAPYADEAVPTVSLTSAASTFVLDEAEIVLELSHFIHKDVPILFEVTGIEPEAIDLPLEYTIEAGALKKVIPVHIDEEKASLGNKTVGIAVKEVQNATLAASSVNIGINIEDVAMVNVSATDFDENLEATLTFTLSKPVTKDVTLEIAYDATDGAERKAYPVAKLEYDGTVTIPAGEKVGTLKVKAVKTGVDDGAYQTHFKVGNYGSNAKAGTTPDATMILNVGFQPTLAASADIDFIYYSGYWYVYRDNLHKYYFIWTEPASAGDASDMDYVKAAMRRCQAWIQDDANRKAWMAIWDGYGSGYAAYVWHSCPQLSSEKVGYMGWPMSMVDGSIEEIDGGTHHAFLVGFTDDLDLEETYQYYLLEM